MLNIHFGKENLNKEKYMFDLIKDKGGRALLLVPDQFTLQAEKEAFYYLETRGLIDLEVLSFSRLGARIIAETGGGVNAKIDAYGRYMLLTKIAAENRDKLKLFKNSSRLSSFAQMANDLIYEMKQYNTAPADLLEMTKSIENDLILKQKLEDISFLYKKYEEYTRDKYLDGEDYLELVTSKIQECSITRDAAIWVYGFDYFTPKNMSLLKELMKHADEMNVLMTYDSDGEEGFELTSGVIKKMAALAKQNEMTCVMQRIPASYLKGSEKREALAAVSDEFFSLPVHPCSNSEGVTLITAANPYSEIETAAAYVLELVRTHGLKYKDIAIICNDLDERAIIAKRTFSEYGIDLFIDQKRSFTHNAAVKFILSLLRITINGWKNPDIFSMIKSGITGMQVSQYEELENYVLKYKVKGTKWRKEFWKGGESGEDLSEIEASRQALAALLTQFETPFKEAKTVREKVEVLYNYLAETVRIPEKLEQMEALETERNFHEIAEQTAQTWKSIINIFDQFVGIMGGDEVSGATFTDVLRVGFESVEVGLLPPTADGLIFGTMQRMRIGRIKALLIIGANEGILPVVSAKEGLLNEDEKIWLSDKKMEICRADSLRLQEEQLAIYKNIAKPEQFLWISHAVSDNDGGKLNPSSLFSYIREVFPDLQAQKDLKSQTGAGYLIQSRRSTLMHMTDMLRDAVAYERMPSPEWECVADWYRKNEKEAYGLIVEGLLHKNSPMNIDAVMSAKLYEKGHGEMTLSPLRIERYGKCPFSFFVNYGLFPEERRVFEMANREIGDIYHNCIMRFSMELTEADKKITSHDSKWMTVTREECDELINFFIDSETGNYKDGNEEIYRIDRIKTVCAENAWILVRHVRQGDILRMDFEEKFGFAEVKNPKRIPAIEVKLQSGKKVLVEGKIDRIDILADGSVKIIDYKSGRENFDISETKAGFQLQLMLYLKAAQKQKYEPAGVFYFMIDERADTGRMDGAVINKVSVIDQIAGDFQDYSNIIPIRKLKNGEIRGNNEGNLLSEPEFAELQEAVDNKVRQLCEGLVSGCIDIRPGRAGDKAACEYCGYKSICMFDLAFDGCTYESASRKRSRR